MRHYKLNFLVRREQESLLDTWLVTIFLMMQKFKHLLLLATTVSLILNFYETVWK